MTLLHCVSMSVPVCDCACAPWWWGMCGVRFTVLRCIGWRPLQACTPLSYGAHREGVAGIDKRGNETKRIMRFSRGVQCYYWGILTPQGRVWGLNPCRKEPWDSAKLGRKAMTRLTKCVGKISWGVTKPGPLNRGSGCLAELVCAIVLYLLMWQSRNDAEGKRVRSVTLSALRAEQKLRYTKRAMNLLTKPFFLS